MQIFLDFLPVIAFFAVYQLDNIYSAVVATAITAVAVFAFTWFRNKRIEPLQLASMVIISLAATLTVVFRDDAFIKWKPTIINGLFAAVFAFSLIGKKTLAEKLLGSQLALPSAIWRNLTLSWILFFTFCALANYVVAFTYSVNSDDLNASQKIEYQLIQNEDPAYAELLLKQEYDSLSNAAQQQIATLTASERADEYLASVHQQLWVNFKLFGMLAITVVFIVLQGLYLSRHLRDPEPSGEPEPGSP